MKNPGVAAVLSFFVTGLGQIYNGQIGKGLFWFFVQVVNVVLMFIFIGYLTFLIVWVWGIYDAYRCAEKINARNAEGV